MAKNNLVFGGINSADYNVWISGSDAFSAPERDVEYVSVPGRNGDLVIDNGKWNNIRITYPAFIPKGFESQIDNFRSEMMKLTGYHRLEDSYHPDEFRMASFSYGISPSRIGAFLRNGEFPLTFNCKPQRFLKSGEIPVQFMPFCIVSGVYSKYVPIPRQTNLTVEVHCAPTDTLTIKITEFDAQAQETIFTSYTCENGDVISRNFGMTAKFWQINITGHSSIDTTWLRIKTITEYNGETIPIDAIMCRSFSMLNPTGYACKPLIECFATALGYWDITNTNAQGELESEYAFHGLVTNKNHFYMDCDLQYVYADDNTNLSDRLILTSMQGHGLVFPDLGTHQIDLQMYYVTKDADTGIGLVQFYPRWWKL